MTERAGRGIANHSGNTGPGPRSFAARLLLAACAALLFLGFVGLGTWQIQRLHWKRALIERVEERVHADPVPAPDRARWPHITAESDEYRHVRVEGSFLHELSTLTLASTALGSGYWVITPLRDTAGNIVLINRGFIPARAANRVLQQLRSGANNAVAAGQRGEENGPLVITGLLRVSEPGGGFLRRNDPGNDRWYSRDVQAIAAARGLADVAPYFVDADAAPASAKAAGDDGQPIGGMTVISFRNNHLVYALTWYALALMVAGAGFWIAREERRQRRGGAAFTDRIDRENDDGWQS